MATYAFRTGIGGDIERISHFAMPTPIHAQTEAAADAGEAIRRHAHEWKMKRLVSSLVTQHGHPRVEPYDGPTPAAAVRMAKLARSLGFEVLERKSRVGHVVEGFHRARRVGFRAYWTRGKADGATWHTAGGDQWKLVDISSRPIGIDKIKKVTKAGHRHDENDRTRLVLVASPRGVSCNITELERRIKS